MRAVRLCRWLPLLAMLMAAGHAQGLEGKGLLDVSIRPLVNQPRSEAPLLVDVTFNYNGARLLEGVLELVVMDGNEAKVQWRSDLALTNGAQTFRMMLPAVAASGGNPWADLRMRFVAEKEAYDLGVQTLFVPSTWRRSFAVCVSRAHGQGDEAHAPMARSLLLDRFDPGKQAAAERTYSCSPAFVDPQDLPAVPLGYCAFDIVFLAGEGFSRVEARQLEALLRWVDGGGSVCVVPGGGLKAHHLRFLEGLGVAPELAVQLQPERGPGPVDAAPPGGTRMLRPGMGRAVVVWPGPAAALDSADWRAAVAFLWKVRKEQLAEFAGKGCWRTDLEREWPGEGPGAPTRAYAQPSRPEKMSFLPQPLSSAGDLSRGLMPEAVRLLPLGLVALLSLLFVLAVGPLDYVVLGMFRRRRYTWVVFPLVSLGFTALFVTLAAHSMSTGDVRRAFLIADLGKEGKVLRWTRYELTFCGKEKSETTRVQNALYARLSQAAMLYGPYAREGSTRSELTACKGRMPADYAVHRWLGKWTPLLERFFSFEPAVAPPEADWDAVGPADFSTYAARRQVAAKMFGARLVPGLLFLLNGWRMQPLAGDESVFRARRGEAYGLADMSTFLHQVCVAPPEGLFSVVSQVSPTGGTDFGDLGVLDPTDEEQWMLVLVTRVGGDYHVYRRLYCGGP